MANANFRQYAEEVFIQIILNRTDNEFFKFTAYFFRINSPQAETKIFFFDQPICISKFDINNSKLNEIAIIFSILLTPTLPSGLREDHRSRNRFWETVALSRIHIFSSF